MEITNAKEAERCLKSGVSMGVIREIIAGLVLRDAIMKGNPRYSDEEVQDNSEAIGVLKRAYFNARGVEWSPLN